jgi:cytidylate kinase
MKNISFSIIISGEISSGKSTISELLSNRLNIPVVSFGKYLKHYCINNDIKPDRKNLQDIGERFIITDISKFLNDTINFAAPNCDSLIFEGVRHSRMLELIKSKSVKTKSFFLEMPKNQRLENFKKREKEIDIKKDSGYFENLNKHKVEQEISNVKELCEYIISSGQTAEITSNTIYSKLKKDL